MPIVWCEAANLYDAGNLALRKLSGPFSVHYLLHVIHPSRTISTNINAMMRRGYALIFGCNVVLEDFIHAS